MYLRLGAPYNKFSTSNGHLLHELFYKHIRTSDKLQGSTYITWVSFFDVDLYPHFVTSFGTILDQNNSAYSYINFFTYTYLYNHKCNFRQYCPITWYGWSTFNCSLSKPSPLTSLVICIFLRNYYGN